MDMSTSDTLPFVCSHRKPDLLEFVRQRVGVLMPTCRANETAY